MEVRRFNKFFVNEGKELMDKNKSKFNQQETK